ncbi:MAG: hypothetical protein L3J98_07530 [Gammaproteobacteria bacterium]|nr:hypothetical protein [Gammaproteobacteria bacterium]MCF6259998.1 hypothetical protein [Gammaproteobacteria bacterium]
MTKELGSKLANSVRQAKAKQPQKNTQDTQQVSETPAPKVESELPLSPLPARRVWPD